MGKVIPIMGVPYVFARQKLKKPFHAEVVKLVQRGVLCHNGCGLYYVPTEAQISKTPHLRAGSICPDCHAPPKLGAEGQDEEIEVTVRMAFGNVSAIDFLRSLGPKLAPPAVVCDRHQAPAFGVRVREREHADAVPLRSRAHVRGVHVQREREPGVHERRRGAALHRCG
jgi:hypothetical protein